MDPITMILAALAAGAGKAAAGVAPDVYAGLKSLIQKKFAGKPVAGMVLDEHERDPDNYAALLKKNLLETGVDKDEEIVKAAAELLENLNPEQAPEGRYALQVSADKNQGLIQHNSGKIIQNFN